KRDAWRERPQQPVELAPHEEGDARPAVGEEREIAGELDDVAKPLLLVDDDPLAGELLAAPDGIGRRQKARPRVVELPAGFVARPARREIAERQRRDAAVEQRAGIVRPQ